MQLSSNPHIVFHDYWHDQCHTLRVHPRFVSQNVRRRMNFYIARFVIVSPRPMRWIHHNATFSWGTRSYRNNLLAVGHNHPPARKCSSRWNKIDLAPIFINSRWGCSHSFQWGWTSSSWLPVHISFTSGIRWMVSPPSLWPSPQSATRGCRQPPVAQVLDFILPPYFTRLNLQSPQILRNCRSANVCFSQCWGHAFVKSTLLTNPSQYKIN